MNYSVNESLKKHLVDRRWMNSTDGYKEPAAFKELAVQRCNKISFSSKKKFASDRNMIAFQCNKCYNRLIQASVGIKEYRGLFSLGRVMLHCSYTDL